jgi:hypothetical protein
VRCWQGFTAPFYQLGWGAEERLGFLGDSLEGAKHRRHCGFSGDKAKVGSISKWLSVDGLSMSQTTARIPSQGQIEFWGKWIWRSLTLMPCYIYMWPGNYTTGVFDHAGWHVWSHYLVQEMNNVYFPHHYHESRWASLRKFNKDEYGWCIFCTRINIEFLNLLKSS